ncbi:MAG: flagellar hook-length control protein FliK [Gammaproteobacteria bacterium]|nr:flagellar hook-length control protein FliK [Gammaproteobacteria bacterium]
MAESQNTFFLVNIGAQSSQGVTSAQGRTGSVASAGNHESGSGKAFSRVLASQVSQGDGYAHPGLQKALQELSRILESRSGSGPPGVVSASNILAARQSLPVPGSFLPENVLQRINQLLGALSEPGSVLPEQARLHLQQGLQQVFNGSSEPGLVLPEQVSQRLQQLLERLAESGTGLTGVQVASARQIQPEQAQTNSSETALDLTKALPEKAHERLQQLLDLPADSKLALPEQARQRLQQLLDRSADTGSPDSLQGTLSEQALQQLRLLLERPPGTDLDLSEGLPDNARQHLQKLLEIADKAEVASLANPLTEAIRSIVQDLRVIVPAEKAGDTVTASIVADVMKSSRLVNLDPDSETRNGPVSARMLALRAASSVVSDNTGAAGNFDKEVLQLARTGFDLQGQTASRLVAMNSVSGKIIEQISIKDLSLSPMQTANIQSAEAKDISSLLLPVSNISPKVSADSQLFSPQARLEMQQSLQHSGWGRELGSKVVWMTRQEIQTANIRINPPHLGPIEVRVEVKNDTANVSFITQHAAVRDVIESSVPRLREMLGENGLNLENVDVADQSSAREQQRQAHAEDDFLSSAGNSSVQNSDEIESEVPGDILSASVSLQGAGLIDYYV